MNVDERTEAYVPLRVQGNDSLTPLVTPAEDGGPAVDGPCARTNLHFAVSLAVLVVVVSLACAAGFAAVRARHILTDGELAIRDLGTLLPEVRSALNILENICSNPELAKFCNGSAT